MKNLFTDSLPSTILGVCIALGMIVAMRIHSQTQLVLARDEITVKGVAFQDVEADYGTWNIGISVIADKRSTSLSEMERQQKMVADYLSQFSSFDVKMGIPKTQEEYEYSENKKFFKGYSSSISFSVVSWKVDDLFKQASTFNTFAVNNNLNISNNLTDFYYSKLDDLKLELLEKAVADAQKRAQALGSSSNTKIGKVKSASQGAFQINERNDFSVSAGGNYNTATKEKTVQATVDITFEVL